MAAAPKPGTLIELSRNIEWRTSTGVIDYPDAIRFMEERAGDIHGGHAPEAVWLLEHPPLYTAGTSADEKDLLSPDRFPVYATGRGGEYTYHGPGQRVAYVMLDLTKRGNDIRAYVHNLESWIISSLARFGVTGERREGRVGIWVRDGSGGEEKIAAIGVRISRWVSWHGIAINLDPDLTAFERIIPCGVRDGGVTSLAAQGITCDLKQLDASLATCFERHFPDLPA